MPNKSPVPAPAQVPEGPHQQTRARLRATRHSVEEMLGRYGLPSAAQAAIQAAVSAIMAAEWVLEDASRPGAR